MGFFNILETFFFISLAITFVLIMMLVYHFKGRITVLEQKCDTMFDIMNNIVKEMRTIKINSNINQFNPSMMIPNNESIIFGQGQNLGEMFKCFNQYEEVDEDDDEDDDEEEIDNYQKIVVSDTEIEDDQPVKIINIDFENENESNESNESSESINNLEDLEEENITVDDDDEPTIDEQMIDEHLEKSIDFKKLDISYLRTMVITRGLATDTKKMKKGDLIRLLEDSQE